WLQPQKGITTYNNYLIVYVYNLQGFLSDIPKSKYLEFYANMPSMGHDLEDSGNFRRLTKGIYINDSIRLNMGGEWSMELWLLDRQDNITDSAKWIETW
ncbi:MAG: hypothetical protein KDD40_09285, partial [Bdellovibrionales bacterium]|nr:hypothetical protein [Bdellovibrionales bacterium]